MMKNSDLPAMPSKISVNRDTDQPDPYQFDNNGFVAPGLSKREHFAAMALNTVLSSYNPYESGYFDSGEWDAAAKNAVGLADALLAALETDDE